jgi:hypothetical protein
LDKRNQGQKTTCAKFVFMDMLLFGGMLPWDGSNLPQALSAVSKSGATGWGLFL